MRTFGPLEWPPRTGQKVVFIGDSGIELGVLQQIRQGFGVPGHRCDQQHGAMKHLLMTTEPRLWRDPDTVREEEAASLYLPDPGSP